MYELNEDEQNQLETSLMVCGFDTYETDFFESAEYKKLASEFINCFPRDYTDDISFKYCTKNQLLEAGKIVIDKHTYGTDTRVRYVDTDWLHAELLTVFGDSPKEEKIDEIIQFIDNNIELIKVTNVPIELDVSESTGGFVKSTAFYANLSDEYLEKIRLASKNICIHGICNDNAKSTYVHEMYHALTASHKGCIENYLHNEVLPIYMERITGLDLDPTGELERKFYTHRLLNNKQCLIRREWDSYTDDDAPERMELEKYLLSSVLATALFDTYKKGNNKIKREIDDSINGLFREEVTLEYVMDQFEITPEKGSNIMRRHIKKLTK